MDSLNHCFSKQFTRKKVTLLICSQQGWSNLTRLTIDTSSQTNYNYILYEWLPAYFLGKMEKVLTKMTNKKRDVTKNGTPPQFCRWVRLRYCTHKKFLRMVGTTKAAFCFFICTLYFPERDENSRRKKITKIYAPFLWFIRPYTLRIYYIFTYMQIYTFGRYYFY